jgi:PAS domain S-box-containing protein
MNMGRKKVTEYESNEKIRTAINFINQIIHSTLDFDEIMRRTVSEAAKAIGSETAAISLRKGECWVVSYVYGFPEDVIGAEMNDEEETHAVLAIKTKKPVAISDAFNDERVNRNHMKKWGIRSVLVVPLITRDEVIGVIFFNFQKSIFIFENIHVDFAAQLAASISLALENSRIFKNMEMELAERKKSEETLRKSEERLHALISVSSQVLYRMSPDWQEMRELQGSHFLTDTKEPNRNWLNEYIHPDDQPRVCEVIRNAIRNGAVFELEHRVLRTDGTLGWTASRAVPVRNAAGEIVEWFGAASDITERKRIEETLLESEQLFSKTFHGNPAAIAITSAPDYRYVDANETWLKLFGYRRDEVIGRTSKELNMFPSNYAEREAIVEKTIEKGSTRNQEIIACTKTGEPLNVLLSTEVVDIGGKVHILSAIVDLTERKRAEEALRKSEKKYRVIVETAGEGIWLLDAETRTTFVNKKLSEMLGYSPEEIIGKKPIDFVDEEKKALVSQYYEQRLQNLKGHVEQKFIRKDGTPLWVLSNATKLLNDNGQTIGFLGMVTDITELKDAESKLKNVLDNLEEKVKERTLEIEKAYNLLRESEESLAEAQKMAHIGN